jgi:hypothetical protein
MIDLSRDPIINVINNGIKRDIKVSIENNCWRAAMSFLNLPSDREDVSREDFIEWVERYIKFLCKEQLSGLDLYGARCSILHTYSAESKLSKTGKCRIVGYMYKSTPEEVVYNDKVSTELVMVSILGLKEAFFNGIDQFLINVFSDSKHAPIVEKRLKKLYHALPVKAER